MKLVKILLALVGLVLVFIFCSGNDTKVVLNFLDYSSPEIYLFLLLLTTFVLGMITASFATTIKMMQLKRQIRQLQPDTAEDVTPENKKDKKKKKKKKGDEKVEPAPAKAQSVTETVTEQPQQRVVEPATESPADPSPQTSEEVTEAIFEEPEEEPAAELETPEVIELPASQPEQPSTTDDDSQNKQA
ncbi:MAG: DUF1049 domain-containing protein [Desulfuromonas sp.]|nr:DUF1049 domain-containing protein [Desulfuromonas sp.]